MRESAGAGETIFATPDPPHSFLQVRLLTLMVFMSLEVAVPISGKVAGVRIQLKLPRVPTGEAFLVGKALARQPNVLTFPH